MFSNHIILKPLILLSSGLLAAILIGGCLQPQASVSPTPDPSLEFCQIDEDCLLAIRVDQCCPCPEAAPKVLVDSSSGLEVYLPGFNYAPLLPEECASVICAPCPPLAEGVVCSHNQCEAVLDSE